MTSMTGRLMLRRAVLLPSNLSVGLAPASSPSRGASGVSSKLHPTAKASPIRGGGIAQAMTEGVQPKAAFKTKKGSLLWEGVFCYKEKRNKP